MSQDRAQQKKTVASESVKSHRKLWQINFIHRISFVVVEPDKYLENDDSCNLMAMATYRFGPGKERKRGTNERMNTEYTAKTK